MFEMKITLGNVIQILIIAAAVVSGYASLSSGVTSNRESTRVNSNFIEINRNSIRGIEVETRSQAILLGRIEESLKATATTLKRQEVLLDRVEQRLNKGENNVE